MFIETETTPNPATLKFLPQRQVMPQGTRDFANPEDAEASPLAQALFATALETAVDSQATKDFQALARFYLTVARGRPA